MICYENVVDVAHLYTLWGLSSFINKILYYLIINANVLKVGTNN